MTDSSVLIGKVEVITSKDLRSTPMTIGLWSPACHIEIQNMYIHYIASIIIWIYLQQQAEF